MNSKTYFYLTLFGGWLGLHKFATGRIKMGILYLFTFGLFGIGWVLDIIKAASASKTIVSTDLEDAISNLNEKTQLYYSNMQNIESMWSVMYNLKIVNGDKAVLFEQKCKENILELQDMISAARVANQDYPYPPYVAAYVRLCMLYERQERYQDAIDICISAIKAGAVDDGNKGRMYGRLARLIKKSGITVESDVLSLIDKNL